MARSAPSVRRRAVVLKSQGESLTPPARANARNTRALTTSQRTPRSSSSPVARRGRPRCPRGERDEPQDVVDHGGSQDGAGHGRARGAGILEHAGADADARGGHGRRDEDLHEAARGRHGEPTRRASRTTACRRCPATATRADDAPTFEHVAHGRLEAHLEEEDEHADAREHVEPGVRRQLAEERDGNAAEPDAQHELPQDRRLAQARGQVPADLRRHEDQRQRQSEARDRVRGRPHRADYESGPP